VDSDVWVRSRGLVAATPPTVVARTAPEPVRVHCPLESDMEQPPAEAAGADNLITASHADP
jgi:hypothetical protein